MTVRFLLLPVGVAASLSAASALAQSGVLSVPPLIVAPPATTDPVEALGRYLRVLAVFPRNLDALTGAGRSSLAIGDANAAISFFARAQDIAPGDGRIKAGLASALVQLEQPKTALKLFDQAVALGVPEADIASDRGLARDLRGDTRRAQADYALALRARPDDETTRRLAVSQAIGGDRTTAMATLDALLRRQDRAAWRVRAFVLALTGDRDGAEASARGAMPLPQAQALMPFFARLAGLKPGEKAAAVHLGQFPSDGRSSGNQELFAQAENAASPGPQSDVPLIPAGAPLGAAASANVGEVLSRAPRRRPGSIDAAPASTALAMQAAIPVASGYPAAPTTPPANAPGPVLPPAPLQAYPRTPTAPASAVPAPPIDPVALPSAPPPSIVVPAGAAEIPTLPAMTPPVVTPPAALPQVAMAVPTVQATQIPAGTAALADPNAPIVETRFGPALALSVASAPVRLAVAEPVRPTPPAPKPAPLVKAPPTAKPAADPPFKERQIRVNSKDSAAQAPPPVQRNAKGKLAAADAVKAGDTPAKDGKPAKARAKGAAAEKDKPSEPSGGERYWVQVASGANKADLGRAWEKTRTRAPKLLEGRTTYTSPWKASNRLLVGPFKSEEEAQSFVNTLGKAGMGGMQFTSRGKTKVERLSGD